MAKMDIELEYHCEGLKRQEVSMCEFYCFRFQQRLNEGHTLLRSGRLLQRYMIDCYMAKEEERFRWIRKHKKELRSEIFSGLMDAIHRGDSESSKVGKSIILPSSHTGGSRYRVKNYQDAMCICKWAGYPDLFITFTCNPKWPKINGMQQLIGQKNDINRVYIICRVFEIKLYQLMQDLRKEEPFGKVTALEHTVLFEEGQCVENVLSMPRVDKTKFTEWLETNKYNEDAINQTISTSTVIDHKPVFETLNFLDLNLPAPDEENDTSVLEFSPW
ncbi:hypothetical protein POM88_045043 [Heracleum sosnowskyi]|uniref:Helitron helicase-like domain-containing protein n=1 Tax=Heracleum sosnowskyi TaxID=360622 RepID=A0AAD8H6J1_9APIA|nr:hypothetical protein POM88_045043 [Heracleum sosnowskyi]